MPPIHYIKNFIIQIDSVGKNFAKPVTRVLKGVLSSSFTSKELNTIVFGFGDVSAPYALEMRILSSYANNNEQYLSNVVNVVVTPYIIPVTLSLNPDRAFDPGDVKRRKQCRYLQLECNSIW